MSDIVLAKIDRARLLLSQAKTLQEAKHIADVAEAARVYARRVESSIETVNYAAEIKVRAERLLGDMLAKTPKNKGAAATRSSRSTTLPKLSEIPLSKDQSARSQKLARISEPQFEEAIRHHKAAGKELSTAAVLRSAETKIVPMSPDAGGDSDETCWRRGLIYRAKEAIAGAEFEDWSHFKVNSQLVNLATRAAEAWSELAAYLKKLKNEKTDKTRAA